MSFKDLREFIAKLEEVGEAKRIEEEVDWNLEAGAMVRRAGELGLPAPFFQNIKGDNFVQNIKGDKNEYGRIFGGVLSKVRRVAVAMDMDPDTPVRDLIDEYICRKSQPIKPVLVKDGPCKENIQIGDKIDLLKFPVPLVHEGDGGRYIGTWHLTITKDPETDWVNWGMYRHMLHDRNTVGLQAGPATHIRKIQAKSGDRPMEIAIAIGVEPASTICAASPIPYGVTEVDIAGGIRGNPIELVKCETVDLEVPATAEIVIEGEVRPGDLRDEGPFGEYTGYVGGRRLPRSVVHVKAVTHRNNPIFTMSCMGVPVGDDHAVQAVTRSAGFLEALKAEGIPVVGVYVPPEASTYMVVVAIRSPEGRADHVAHTVWASRVGGSTPYVVVVGEDVDPFNLPQVIHTLCTRCHPTRGIHPMPGSTQSALVPFLTRHEQLHLIGAKVYFDCTWPPDWGSDDIPPKCSFDTIYPSEVQKKALYVWKKYGY